jgi:hypothetical protein
LLTLARQLHCGQRGRYGPFGAIERFSNFVKGVLTGQPRHHCEHADAGKSEQEAAPKPESSPTLIGFGKRFLRQWLRPLTKVLDACRGRMSLHKQG